MTDRAATPEDDTIHHVWWGLRSRTYSYAGLLDEANLQRLGFTAREQKLIRQIAFAGHCVNLNEFRRIVNPSISQLPSRQDQALAPHSSVESKQDGAIKYIMKHPLGYLLETVLLQIRKSDAESAEQQASAYSGRRTVCVSSQVGCAARCVFCATGQMGMSYSLTANQILDQVEHVQQCLATRHLGSPGPDKPFEKDRKQITPERVRNVVFMGMGEPFLNQEAVFSAIDVLTHPKGFGLSNRHVTVSTVGIPSGIRQYGKRFGQHARLAVSLHSADQAVRESIIPLAQQFDLDALRLAMGEFQITTGQPIFIEYIMLADRNDSLADAELLANYLAGVRVHVNLIPYNPMMNDSHEELKNDGAASQLGRDPLAVISTATFDSQVQQQVTADPHQQIRGSDPATIIAFQQRLQEFGLKVTRRYSLGSDIAAACGQLVQSANRSTK